MYFSEKDPSERVLCWPKKFNIYWDMNIPTEYYEDEFLEFENYLDFTLKRRPDCFQSKELNGDFYLAEFRKFENYQNKESSKLRKKLRKQKEKAKAKNFLGEKLSTSSKKGKSRCGKQEKQLMKGDAEKQEAKVSIYLYVRYFRKCKYLKCDRKMYIAHLPVSSVIW